MPLPWRVEMLGGLRVVQSDRTITRFQTQKTGGLLAYLALNLKATHSREFLAELLWPGADPVAVRNRLNQAVSSLRRQLEPPGIVYGTVLVTDQRSVRLNPDAIETDVDEFVSRVALAESAASAADKKTHLKRSIDLYGGDFLQGYYTDWATMEQLRLSDLYSSALFDLLDVSRETGDVDQAIRAATLLLKDDPSDEGTHCDLMRLYLDAGRPAAAKRQFEELTRILALDNESPSDEAYDLNREASSARSLTAKPIQIVAETPLKVELPPIEDFHPALPSPLNRFIGREAEISLIKQMLGDGQVRLVTIVGMGGCGKTRLALQTAHDLEDRYPRSIFFVSMADLRDASQIEEEIANSLGIGEPDNIIRRLRQIGRSLVILDNFEHLAESGSGVIQSLLESVPSLQCVVTSRCPIKIDAERCFHLSPLPSPSESESVSELIENPSIALFVDRAQAALPDFQLTPRNAGVVRLLSQRLEGLPLAIELAASWAKTVAPSQMLAMLDDRFALLESRRRDISPRHRTMRAVIDYGVGLLSPDLALLFYRLSIFQGGWTLEAAAEVCQRPDVLHAMDKLVEQSLILAECLDSEASRFRMLDTLRDYASEHLAGHELAETANLHAQYFSKFVETSTIEASGSSQSLCNSLIESELPNLTAAFRWYRDHGLIGSALSLANWLVEFWEIKGRAREGRRWIESCLARIDQNDPIDERVLAESMTALARLTWIHGDFEQATQLHERCLSAWVKIGDSRGIFFAQLNIQLEAHRTRNYDRSFELLTDNLQRADELGDKNLLARTWLALGNTAVEMRKFEDARSHYEQSLRFAREAENRNRIATALNNLGNLAWLTQQRDLSRHYLLQSLELFEEDGAKAYATGTLIQLAKLERHEQDIEASRRWLSRAWNLKPEASYHIQALFLEHAHSALARNNPLLAATLLGFVDRQREESGALNFDVEQDENKAFIESVKSLLSSEAFEEAWNLGRTLEIAEAACKVHKG